MIDFAAVIAADFAVPDRLDLAVDDLVGMLASADPAVRDDLAYPVLAVWIRRGALDDQLHRIGDAMTLRLSDPRIQARTFAPLILASTVNRDTAAATNRHLLDPNTIVGWLDGFLDWWLAEADIRGWDSELGWLHAIAHGADLAGAFGESPHLDATALSRLLVAIAERIVAQTTYQYAHQEEDRIGYALRRILTRPELTVDQATSWLSPVDRLFADAAPGPVPVPVVNTLAVLRAAYVMVDRGLVPHRRAVTDAIIDRLRVAFDRY